MISSRVFFTSPWSLATFSVSSVSAWLPLRLSWVTPAVSNIQTSDASMTKTTRTFPAVDISSLLPETQGEKRRHDELTPGAKHLESYRPMKLRFNGGNRPRIAIPAFWLNLPQCTLLSGIPPTWKCNGSRVVAVGSHRWALGRLGVTSPF